MTEKIAFVFPGQGSQSVGMGRSLAHKYTIAKETFTSADEILGINLSRIAWEGPEDELNDTINTQPALFVHSIAVLRVLKQELPELSPNFVAGHSMGELSALTASGVLSFEAGLRLVRTRGRLMKEAGEKSPGGMVAILGLDIPTLEQICKQVSLGDEIVRVANDNCPGQVVLSGTRAGLERSLSLAKELGAKRAISLAVSIAAHSPLMSFAQEEFNQAVSHAPFSTPGIPVIGNVSALALSTSDEIRKDLQAQLTHRVRWTESIEYMASEGASTFLELGNGNVLSGLGKRIDRDTVWIALGTPEDFENLSNKVP